MPCTIGGACPRPMAEDDTLPVRCRSEGKFGAGAARDEAVHAMHRYEPPVSEPHLLGDSRALDALARRDQRLTGMEASEKAGLG